MKKLLLIANIFASTLYAINAVAFNYMYGWYGHAQGGGSILHKLEDSKTQRNREVISRPTYTFGGNIGYQFDQFRTDFASHYTQTKIGDINTKVGNNPETNFKNDKNTTGSLLDFMVNGYYDLTLNGPIKLTVGVGAGYGHLKLHYFYKTASSTDLQEFNRDYNLFVYNAILGFRLVVNHMWDLSLEYRFYSTFAQKFGAITTSQNSFFESSIPFHAVNLGIMIKLY